MSKLEPDVKDFLEKLAAQLDEWASSSENWGWSTQQVKPQREKADEIRRFIWQKSR